MRRWVIARPPLRVILVGLSALALLQLAFAIAAFLQATRSTEAGFTFPGAQRVQAIVAAVEDSGPKQRADLLAALNDETLDVRIVPTDQLSLNSEEERDLPGVASIVESYVDTVGDREVVAWLATDPDGSTAVVRRRPFGLWSEQPIRMAISLRDGGWLMLETRGNLARTIFGFPPGLWAGLFGVTVAFGALLLLWRSLSPLEGLSAALARFSANPVSNPVKVSGPRETRRIIEAANRMQADLADLFLERQVMFGALSHDLRTLLTRLGLRLAQIADEKTRVSAERDLVAMNDIVEDALLLAQLDVALKSDDRIELGELADALLQTTDLSKNVIHLSDEMRDIHIGGDGISWLRALRNLVENAMRYGGSCEIDFHIEWDTIRIDVVDRGPGIPAKDRARLMRPFVRGDESRSMNVPGSGLGLAIAARTAERASGALALLDRPGGGLIARIEVPSEHI